MRRLRCSSLELPRDEKKAKAVEVNRVKDFFPFMACHVQSSFLPCNPCNYKE